MKIMSFVSREVLVDATGSGGLAISNHVKYIAYTYANIHGLRDLPETSDLLAWKRYRLQVKAMTR